jgi:hypothetical protein
MIKKYCPYVAASNWDLRASEAKQYCTVKVHSPPLRSVLAGVLHNI